MDKSLLILGAGRGQVGLIKASKRLGYNTIVASIRGNYPGFSEADNIVYADITDKDSILKTAQMNSVCGVASSCIDLPLPAQGYVNDTLGLTGISYNSAILSTNKYLMKKALISAGVSTPKYCKITSLRELKKSLQTFDMPVMIKAVDQQGSKGVGAARTNEEAEEAYKKAMLATDLDYCILEECIEGHEFGCNAMIYKGEVIFILPAGNISVNRNIMVTVGHYMPLEFTAEVDKKINEQMTRGIHALGLDNCVVNADLMVQDGKIYILEITGRQGANALPEIISARYNIDMYEIIARLAANDMGDFDLEIFNYPREITCLAEMMISEDRGIIEDVSMDQNALGKIKGVKSVAVFKKKGDPVNYFMNPADCIGQIVVEGKDMNECKASIAEVRRCIKFRIDKSVSL